MKELHEDGNAQVYRKIVSEENRTQCYNSNPKGYRNVSVQVGAPTYPPKKRTTRAATGTYTPKKVKKDLPKTKGVTPLNVKSSPGPSGSKKKPKVTKRNASGKFHVCHTIWESRSNLKFRARNGHRKITWIGCNKKGCEFWAHVQVYF